MTREDIIRNLKYTMEKHKNDTVNTFGTNISVMCKDILYYLEQEPCEDAISREATLKTYKDLNDEDTISVWLIRKNIEQQPPVNSQPKWIPVSEGLPEKEMNCLVTDSLGKVHNVTFYHALDGRGSYFTGCYVVRAWMPLPAPFEPRESENK